MTPRVHDQSQQHRSILKEVKMDISLASKKEVGFQGLHDPNEETKKSVLPNISRTLEKQNNDSLPLIDRVKNTTPILDLDEVIKHEGELVLDPLTPRGLDQSVINFNGQSNKELSKNNSFRRHKENVLQSDSKVKHHDEGRSDAMGLRETATDGEFPKATLSEQIRAKLRVYQLRT